MNNETNTVQSILLQLANVLEPLQRELAPGRARNTMAELGIVITATQAGLFWGKSPRNIVEAFACHIHPAVHRLNATPLHYDLQVGPGGGQSRAVARAF